MRHINMGAQRSVCMSGFCMTPNSPKNQLPGYIHVVGKRKTEEEMKKIKESKYVLTIW